MFQQYQEDKQRREAEAGQEQLRQQQEEKQRREAEAEQEQLRQQQEERQRREAEAEQDQLRQQQEEKQRREAEEEQDWIDQHESGDLFDANDKDLPLGNPKNLIGVKKAKQLRTLQVAHPPSPPQ
jgi:hypothetical protein